MDKHPPVTLRSEPRPAALLGGPELLIRDQAASARGRASAAAIAQAIARLTKSVIGHCGALPGLADATIWLESGRVVNGRI